MSLRACIAAATVLVLCAPAAADEDDYEQQEMTFAEKSGNLVVSGAFSKLFNKKTYKKLSSGIEHTVVARLYVFEQKDTETPVSFALATFAIRYDLWDENWVVKITSPLGEKTMIYARKSKAFAAVSELDEFPIAPLERIEKGVNHFMAMIVELNPKSEKQMAQVRKWLSKPTSGGGLSSGSSFFGSFVSVFVNVKLPRADATLKVKSQPFYRPKSKSKS